FEGGGSVSIQEGNYTDYAERVKQRPAERAAATAEGPQAAAAREAAPPREKLRMSYKDQKDFEAIDGWTEETEAALRKTQAAMDEAGSDSVRLQELLTQQAEQEAKLEELLERWTYLNELAERIAEQKR